MTNNTTGFASTGNRGFQMTFANGMTISVQFGTSNYCSRRNFDSDIHGELKQHVVHSPNAEVAVWDVNNQWFFMGSDQVKGFVSPDEVAQWINAVSSAEHLDDLHDIAVGAGLIENIFNQR